MAAVGQMFYTDADWHRGTGCRVPPLTLDEAVNAGGLAWEVEDVNLLSPGTSLMPRKAIVRTDRQPSDPRRVLGIVDMDFTPIQNREAGTAIDAVFGRRKAVYHTGGYFGNGERVWLLAKIDRPLRVGKDDIVLPYALLVNDHDGKTPLTIRLTSVRVICANTLALAMHTSVGPMFSHEHRKQSVSCVDAARQFFATAMHDVELWQESFQELARRTCSDTMFRSIVRRLIPDPKPPQTVTRSSRAWTEWERQLRARRGALTTIEELRESGVSMSLPESRGTLWGALNAITEYVDHHRPDREPHFLYALLGDGMDLKVRALKLIQNAARSARWEDATVEEAPADLFVRRSCCA